MSAANLFGFDRTTTISTRPADEIARAYQQFGQEDDITVLTLTFAPAETLSRTANSLSPDLVGQCPIIGTFDPPKSLATELAPAKRIP